MPAQNPRVDYIVTVPISTEPVTLQECKDYARIDFTDATNDGVITELISDARDFAERYTRRALAPQTIQAIIEQPIMIGGALSGPVDHPNDWWLLMERATVVPFGAIRLKMDLPMSPAQTLSTLEYQITPFQSPTWTLLPATDPSGNPNYVLDTTLNPSAVLFNTTVAATRYRFTYTAGYGQGGLPLPQNLRTGLKRLVAYMYDNREAEDKDIPESVLTWFRMSKVYTL